MPLEECPKCNLSFNTALDQVVQCPRCQVSGSTLCCNPGGAGCICLDCEERQEVEEEEQNGDVEGVGFYEPGDELDDVEVEDDDVF